MIFDKVYIFHFNGRATFKISALLNESMNLLKAPFLQERGWGEVSLAALSVKPNP
jgi:hypothetical protein